MPLTLTHGGQMSCSYSVSCGLEAGARMQDDSTGKERTAYRHCSHLILQVFSPSWCGVADSQTEHLLNYSGMCGLDVLWAVGFSLFSFLLPTLFIPSHSAMFDSTHGTWTSSPSWVGWRSVVCQSALGLNNKQKKKDSDHWNKTFLLHKKIRHVKFLSSCCPPALPCRGETAFS